MDSNFQVKVTADISALQASMKSVEAQLTKFDASTKKAGSSMNEAAGNANRMSLAAFALGQVIRDSGFFAQNFALGILAISNNIPILIDQLTKLLALSAGVATAISLVASVLTAGLTIWAYSAMAAKDAGEEYEKAMEKANTSSQAQVATFNSLLAIARDTNLSYAQRKQAVDKLNSSHEGLKDTLSVENVNTKASIDLTNRLASSLVLQAQATAIATLAGEAYVENLRAKNSALQDYASTETSVLAQVLRNLGFFTKAEQLLIKDGAKNREEVIAKSQKDYDNYAKKLEEINKKLAESGMLDTSAAKGTNEYKKALDNLSDSLKKINADTSLSFSDRNRALVDAYKSAIGSLATVGTKQAANKILELRDAISQLNKEIYKSEGNALAVKLFNIKTSQDAKDATEAEKQAAEELSNEWERGLYTLDPLYQVAIENSKKLALEQQAANESVTALVRSVGNDLVNAFMVMFETGNMSFNAVGQAILGMIKRLVAAAAAAAVLSAILSTIFPKATNFNFKSVFSMISGLNIGAGVAPTSNPMAGIMTTSGINTSINTANSSSGGGVLETRVSGNDLVILLDRASNNRNKYF